MTIYESVLDAIGETPLLRLRRLGAGLRPAIYAKLEFQNIGGSVKDRAALSMIRAAERDGLLAPGGTLVEGTSGNTGIGLSLVAAHLGYRAVVFAPAATAAEKIRLLRAYGGAAGGSKPIIGAADEDKKDGGKVDAVGGEDTGPAPTDTVDTSPPGSKPAKPITTSSATNKPGG